MGLPHDWSDQFETWYAKLLEQCVSVNECLALERIKKYLRLEFRETFFIISERDREPK